MAMKRKQGTKATIDPELKRQLKQASEGASVQAVFTLRTPAGKPSRSADATHKTVNKMVKQAASLTRSKAHRVQVFPNIQSFALAAPRELVESLLEHKDVAAAVANKQQEDMRIPPARSRIIKIKPKVARRK